MHQQECNRPTSTEPYRVSRRRCRTNAVRATPVFASPSSPRLVDRRFAAAPAMPKAPLAREPDPAADARERRVLPLPLVDHDHVTSLSPRAPLPCARRGTEASPETSMPAGPATAVTLRNAERKSFGGHFGGHCSLPTGTRLYGQGRGGIFMPHFGWPTARTRIRRQPHFPGSRPISRPTKNTTSD